MKLSLITVCRNVAPVIAESIDSVLGQEYPGIELIVIDGASTDGTLDILNAYGNKIDVLLSEPDKGIYDAMNKGLARATGDVIGFVNAGDLLMTPRTIDQVVKAFEQQNVDAVYGDIIMVDEGDISKIKRTWLSGSKKDGCLLTWQHSSAKVPMISSGISRQNCVLPRIMRSSSACCIKNRSAQCTCRRSSCVSVSAA